MKPYIFKMVSSTQPNILVAREGKEGRGIILRKQCVFCGEKMRSQRQRTHHTHLCKDKP